MYPRGGHRQGRVHPRGRKRRVLAVSPRPSSTFLRSCARMPPPGSVFFLVPLLEPPSVLRRRKMVALRVGVDARWESRRCVSGRAFSSIAVAVKSERSAWTRARRHVWFAVRVLRGASRATRAQACTAAVHLIADVFLAFSSWSSWALYPSSESHRTATWSLTSRLRATCRPPVGVCGPMTSCPFHRLR